MSYLFDPEILYETANKGIGLPYEQMFETVRAELEQKYPGKINNKIQWLFNNAGGCMYSIAPLYASLSEYIVIFGSAIGTQGHTGRHFAEIYDFVMDGELWYFKENRPFERIVHQPGDRYYLGKLQSEGLCIPERAWVLEYGRGFILSMMPFGLADSLFSTLDLKTVTCNLGLYGKFLLKNLWSQSQTSSLPPASKEMP
jgi:C-8 sterol isomerase